MSLNWDISNVPDWEKKKNDEKLYKLLDALIWQSLAIGMRVLTEENKGEWLYRMNRIWLDNGHLYSPKIREWRMEDLNPWIGLRTNVSTLTPKEFDDLRRLRTDRNKITRKELDKEPKDWKAYFHKFDKQEG